MADQISGGIVANLPVAASVIAYGSVLGVLAAQKGAGWQQLLFMNLSIFAGSAQFVMVDMWNPPLPVVEIVVAVSGGAGRDFVRDRGVCRGRVHRGLCL